MQKTSGKPIRFPLLATVYDFIRIEADIGVFYRVRHESAAFAGNIGYEPLR